MILAITAKPGSKNPGIELRDGTIVVRVRERAVEGAANEACLHAIAEWLHVSVSSLRIVRGATARTKLIETTLSGAELQERMTAQPSA